MHLIIDADPIVYRCGFSAERTEYHVIVEEEGFYSPVEWHFAPDEKKTAGDKMKKYFKDYPNSVLLRKERVTYPEPEEHAIEAVRTQLYSIEKECREHYSISEFSKISVILSGPGNYRERIATIFPYKGNRDPEHKPHWYQSIRDYLTGTWGAIVVAGREADDECSILARADAAALQDYIIATIDKDLDQIPGNHYNYLKQVFYAQSSDAAERFFYQQCLSGDATDGIPGCWKCGDIGAAKFVSTFGLLNVREGVATDTSASDESNSDGSSSFVQLSRHTEHSSTGNAGGSDGVVPRYDDGLADVSTQQSGGGTVSLDNAGAESILSTTRQFSGSGRQLQCGANKSANIRGASDAGIASVQHRGRPVHNHQSGTATPRVAVSDSAPMARLHTVDRGSYIKLWNGIIAQYRASQTRPGCPYVGRDPEAVALETARLVYLQRAEGELWNPPGIPMGRLPEYQDD